MVVHVLLPLATHREGVVAHKKTSHQKSAGNQGFRTPLPGSAHRPHSYRSVVEVRLVVPSDSIVHHLQVLCVGRLDIEACEGSDAMVKGHQHRVDGVLQPGAKTSQRLEH